MKSLCNSTNGVMVLSDSFATTIFKEAFFRIFDKDEQGFLLMGFNGTFDVQVCPLVVDIANRLIVLCSLDY